jgi:hypothetical protein
MSRRSPIQSPARPPRQGIKRTASPENLNSQSVSSPISSTASSEAASSGAKCVRTRSQTPPASSPGIQRTASAGNLRGQKAESPIHFIASVGAAELSDVRFGSIRRTASGGAAGSVLSLVRTRSASMFSGIQRTASTGQLREQTVESPIHRTASGGAAGSVLSLVRTRSASMLSGIQRTASTGQLREQTVESPIHRTASGGAAGSGVSFGAETVWSPFDMISRTARGGEAVRSDQSSVRQTKASQARAGLVGHNHVQKALAVVQNSGIQAARESLFSSSTMRVAKRSISKAKAEVLQKDIGNEIKEAKGLDHILATALQNSNLSGGMIQQILPEEAWTRMSSLDSAHDSSMNSSKFVRMSSVDSSVVKVGSRRSISSGTSHTKDDDDEDLQGWWIGDVYNGRAGCDIFVTRKDFENQDDEEGVTKGVTKGKKKKLLNGRIKNMIDVKGILLSGSDDDHADIGKQMGQQAFVSLMIGDWRAASDCIKEFKYFTDEERAAALSYTDHDGNTLMHMATMDADVLDVREMKAKVAGKVGIKFEDSTDQIVRENIIQVHNANVVLCNTIGDI